MRVDSGPMRTPAGSSFPAGPASLTGLAFVCRVTGSLTGLAFVCRVTGSLTGLALVFGVTGHTTRWVAGHVPDPACLSLYRAMPDIRFPHPSIKLNTEPDRVNQQKVDYPICERAAALVVATRDPIVVLL